MISPSNLSHVGRPGLDQTLRTLGMLQRRHLEGAMGFFPVIPGGTKTSTRRRAAGL